MVFARERKKLSKNLDTVDSLKSRISGGTTEQHFWDVQTAVSWSATTLCKQSLYELQNDSNFLPWSRKISLYLDIVSLKSILPLVKTKNRCSILRRMVTADSRIVTDHALDNEFPWECCDYKPPRSNLLLRLSAHWFSDFLILNEQKRSKFSG